MPRNSFASGESDTSFRGQALEPFADLPDALVQDLLDKALPVAEGVNQPLQALRQVQASLRAEAERHRRFLPGPSPHGG